MFLQEDSVNACRVHSFQFAGGANVCFTFSAQQHLLIMAYVEVKGGGGEVSSDDAGQPEDETNGDGGPDARKPMISRRPPTSKPERRFCDFMPPESSEPLQKRTGEGKPVAKKMG